MPRLHISGTFSAASGSVCALIPLATGFAFQERHARAQPGRGDAVRVQHHHAAGPVPAAAVAPQRPRHLRQLRVARLRAEIGEALLERRVGAVSRVAPHLAVGLLRLLVGGREQGAVVLLRQRLPVQVVSAREARLARPLAAPVLVDDDAAQRLHAWRNPDRVVDRVGQFARLRRTPRTARGSTAPRPAGRRRKAASAQSSARRGACVTSSNAATNRRMIRMADGFRVPLPVPSGRASGTRREVLPCGSGRSIRPGCPIWYMSRARPRSSSSWAWRATGVSPWANDERPWADSAKPWESVCRRRGGERKPTTEVVGYGSAAAATSPGHGRSSET